MPFPGCKNTAFPQRMGVKFKKYFNKKPVVAIPQIGNAIPQRAKHF